MSVKININTTNKINMINMTNSYDNYVLLANTDRLEQRKIFM